MSRIPEKLLAFGFLFILIQLKQVLAGEDDDELKPAINACCEPYYTSSNYTGDCLSEEFDELWWDVGLEGETLVRTDVSKNFQWIHRRPNCTNKHFLDPDEYDFDKWFLAQVSFVSPFKSRQVKDPLFTDAIVAFNRMDQFSLLTTKDF